MNELFPGDTYKLYFDRTKGTIYGFLTLQKVVAGKTLGGLLLAALKIYITGLIVKKASKL
jgi:hypothetical protein